MMIELNGNLLSLDNGRVGVLGESANGVESSAGALGSRLSAIPHSLDSLSTLRIQALGGNILNIEKLMRKEISQHKKQ